jgi:hypothetical protein
MVLINYRESSCVPNEGSNGSKENGEKEIGLKRVVF